MKTFFEKVKSVLAIIGIAALGIATGALLFRGKGSATDDVSDKKREEKKDEIENADAASLVSGSDNAAALCAARDGIKDDFRERIRNRLRKNIQRLGTSAVNTDNS